MGKKKKKQKHDKMEMDNLRLNPEDRICPEYNSYSLAEYPVAKPDEMGVRVVDNCAEEHIM